MLYPPVAPLPETGFVRLFQIIGNPKATPPITAIFPVSKTTWWKGIKEGRFPQPVKLGPRTTAWRVEDIRRLIESPDEASSNSMNPGSQTEQQPAPFGSPARSYQKPHPHGGTYHGRYDIE
ncbi:helix-turn-helix transcriptional regulator [Geobacter argillaceus]|uniref:helix-turn-helix transcriptional regulator n=1 Tax=Geobacter argillaceus TaxID=345631 RepID=UPI0011A8057C|nr:AlpA family phage regulatory protein [Geobacter argillaceus]